jgi:hypothetical protein
MSEWRVCKAKGKCLGCHTDLYMRFEAQGEGTAEQLAARYNEIIRYPCPNCGTQMTPQTFDPDFISQKGNKIGSVAYFGDVFKPVAG